MECGRSALNAHGRGGAGLLLVSAFTVVSVTGVEPARWLEPWTATAWCVSTQYKEFERNTGSQKYFVPRDLYSPGAFHIIVAVCDVEKGTVQRF